MAKKLGNDYRLWIESATPGTFHEIKGQTSCKISRQAGMTDTSSKDDFPYGTQAPGLKSLTIDFELFPNLPDANGFERLEAVANAPVTTAGKFEIRKGFDTDFGKNAVVTCTGQLTLESAPTVDKLA
jgi:hypothetical protein